MRATLGIDIGTFESKGVLVDGDGGILARASRPHQMLVPQPGWAEHRPEEDWWGDFCAISRQLIADSGMDPKDIRAVGASAIGPCMLPVDADGRALMNGVLYGVDTRAKREIEDLTAAIGIERLLAVGGNALTSQSVGPKILWLKRNRPEIFARTHKILTSTSFLVHRLTGRFAVDHYTASNSTPLYSMADAAWTDDLAADIIAPDRLPDLHWATDIVGGVTAAAAEATGLAVGTPVICGTIDAAAEAVSVGVAAPGDMMLMYGSTMFMIALAATPGHDRRLWHAPWLVPGLSASMAGLATSGTLTHWFRTEFARELDPATAIIALSQEAEASPPGARGLVVLPYFSGERTPIHDPDAKGVIFGLDLTHGRGDLFRAVLEGIGYGTRHVFDTFAEAGRPAERIFAVGGGTNNRVWAQATSDISGLTQIVRQKTLGASYGDAFLAACAVGDAEPCDIQAWNPVASEFVADPAHAAMYERQYLVFRKLYDQTRDLMASLSA